MVGGRRGGSARTGTRMRGPRPGLRAHARTRARARGGRPFHVKRLCRRHGLWGLDPPHEGSPPTSSGVRFSIVRRGGRRLPLNAEHRDGAHRRWGRSRNGTGIRSGLVPQEAERARRDDLPARHIGRRTDQCPPSTCAERAAGGAGRGDDAIGHVDRPGRQRARSGRRTARGVSRRGAGGLRTLRSCAPVHADRLLPGRPGIGAGRAGRRRGARRRRGLRRARLRRARLRRARLHRARLRRVRIHGARLHRADPLPADPFRGARPDDGARDRVGGLASRGAVGCGRPRRGGHRGAHRGGHRRGGTRERRGSVGRGSIGCRHGPRAARRHSPADRAARTPRDRLGCRDGRRTARGPPADAARQLPRPPARDRSRDQHERLAAAERRCARRPAVDRFTWNGTGCAAGRAARR
ncbi:pentapeptide repeat-containing protein [Agromyces sp. SYSU T00194]|uniref:pentapeptide repeat-containing protein n=1 Tax=Agromyces chitinivorans TaxID=3158560 RepID=UPI0033990F5C